ncbi:hypothetical protein ACEN85_12665, partial [Curtobacterium sp. CT11-45]
PPPPPPPPPFFFIVRATPEMFSSLLVGCVCCVLETGSGVRTAFLVGAVISLFGIVMCSLVRRPATPDGAPAPSMH